MDLIGGRSIDYIIYHLEIHGLQIHNFSEHIIIFLRY
jgi:hypothetical protein